ncbi:MAG: tyrosine-type recombinase/integrase [Candidatus Acidiferrales bacterium]
MDEFLSQAPSNNSWQLYSGSLRRFFLFWFARRKIKHIPEPSLRRRAARTFDPYVFSRTEILKLLDATAACQSGKGCVISSETLRTVILVVYGTGIKPTDALALSDGDVDFTKGTLQVGRTSAFSGRVIPLGRDVKRLLKGHLDSYERSRFGRGLPLFLTKKGKSLKRLTIWKTFRRLHRTANVERSDRPYQPRMYDLRHTFAVHSIAHWKRKGIELEKILTLLAAYMGNLDVLGMQRYAALSPCCYQSQLRRLKI